MLAAFWSRPNKAHSNTATSDDTAQELPKALGELKSLSSNEALREINGADIFAKTKQILRDLQGTTADKLTAVQYGLAIADGLTGRESAPVEEVLDLLLTYVGQIDLIPDQRFVEAKVYQGYGAYYLYQRQFKEATNDFQQAINRVDKLDKNYANRLDVKEFKISCLIDTARCYKLWKERNLNHSYCRQASDTVVLLNSYMKIYDYHQQIIANLDRSDRKLAGNQIVDYLHAIISAYNNNFNVPNAYRANVYAYFARELDGNSQPERGNFYARKALELVNYNAELKDSLEDELAWLAFPKERFIDMLASVAPSIKWDETRVVKEEEVYKSLQQNI